ncbi:Gfo/Idh/MocA family oxidoreductase [Aliiroseovarius sp. M344]|uniref:Gfo/Idh/MocA family protein n=1 Tax=Aliiroseovarius sp. M344 TaxID=2867010 RepID=UPI0021AE1773|nr:Gfo/Idh/MocA family oxidoreductase [Aliiroseovarius sp. M344]UWQ15373.1 Gfo/Idh/MocA family oxidoreductase [Aliiroseovarius sp. M344]
MTIRYGLIGSGMMGQEHIRNLNLLDGCEVAAIADPDEGMRNLSVETANGAAQGFANYKDMLSAGLCDAVVVVSPNDTHHAIMMDILDTNLPILCEKPLCTTADHCREVLSKSQTRTAPVWVAMEYRYMPPVQRLLAEVASGTAGTPRMMSIREHRFPFLEKVGDWNRFNARTGGTLVEKCCHFWDLMRVVLESDPVRVYASAAADVNHQDEQYDGHTPDIIDNAFVTVDFANGARGLLDLCMFAEGSYWQEVISVTGAKARVDAKVPGPARFSVDGKERASEIEISHRDSKEIIREEVEVDETVLAAGDHHGSTFFQHKRFRDLVVSGIGKPEVSLEDGLWSVRVGEAAEKSARTGQAVTL